MSAQSKAEFVRRHIQMFRTSRREISSDELRGPGVGIIVDAQPRLAARLEARMMKKGKVIEAQLVGDSLKKRSELLEAGAFRGIRREPVNETFHPQALPIERARSSWRKSVLLIRRRTALPAAVTVK